MAPKTPKHEYGYLYLVPLRQNVAGIEISASEHWVAVPLDRPEPTTARFAAETRGFNQMAKFLRKNAIRTVAMETAGSLWVACFSRLQAAGFQVVLVDPLSLKAVPGRASECRDCEFIRSVYSYALRPISFIPWNEALPLRELAKTRLSLVKDSAKSTNQMIKALRFMNINLKRAVTDVTGETALAIIGAILEGERDPLVLAQLRHPSRRESALEIAKHLDGVYSEHHLWALKLSLETYQFIKSQIEELDLVIIKMAERQLGSAPGKRPNRKPPRPASQS